MSSRGQGTTLAADQDPYPLTSVVGGQASVRVTDAYTPGATSRSESRGRPVRPLPGGLGTGTPPSVSDSQSGATSFHDLGGQAEAMQRLDAQLLGIEADLLEKLAAIKRQREEMAAELDRMDSEEGTRRKVAEPSPPPKPGKFSLMGLFKRKTKKESQSAVVARPGKALPAYQSTASEAGGARAAPLTYEMPPSVSEVTRPEISTTRKASVQFQREPRGSSEKRSSILQARRSNAASMASVQGRVSSGLVSRLAASNRQSTGDSSVHGGGSMHGGKKKSMHHSRSVQGKLDLQGATPVERISIGGNGLQSGTGLGRKSEQSQSRQESIVSLPKGGSYFTEGPTLNAFIKHLTHARAGDDSTAPNVPGAPAPLDRRSRTSDVGRILGLERSNTGQRSANPSRTNALSRMSTVTPRTSGGLSTRTSRTYATSKAGTVTTRSYSRAETESETGSVTRIRTTPGVSELPGGGFRVSCPVIPESSAGLKTGAAAGSPHWAAREAAFNAAPGAAHGPGAALAAVAAARDTRSIDAVKRSNVLGAQRPMDATRFPMEDAPAPVPEPRKWNDAGCFGTLFGCFLKTPPPQTSSHTNGASGSKPNLPSAAAPTSAAHSLTPSVAANGPRGAAPSARKADPWAQLNEVLRSEAAAAESRRGSITALGSRANSKTVTFV